MELRFTAEVVSWRGPAPFLFARLPEEPAAMLRMKGSEISYGWGCIAVTARIEAVEFTTALIPRDGSYLLPLKLAVQRRLGPLSEGDLIAVSLRTGLQPKER